MIDEKLHIIESPQRNLEMQFKDDLFKISNEKGVNQILINFLDPLQITLLLKKDCSMNQKKKILRGIEQSINTSIERYSKEFEENSQLLKTYIQKYKNYSLKMLLVNGLGKVLTNDDIFRSYPKIANHYTPNIKTNNKLQL